MQVSAESVRSPPGQACARSDRDRAQPRDRDADGHRTPDEIDVLAARYFTIASMGFFKADGWAGERGALAPVLIAGGEGRWTGMVNRCTHRGALLHEGEVLGDCIECPWHASVFSLADGAVRSGPATRPQPMLDSRTKEGRLQVRCSEPRTLRTNPTGT